MADDSKKFGTFGGVFTPSILTILGVIMYLRLPTIVGQGGLWMTLIIIAIAHLISATTGLSVASIATDKKVRAGGSYYMISRSLGLPIGGTLGIALFVGMSFSISLYLIGFSESMLGYYGLPQDKNAIRITGSIALAIVAIVTLISTSLALKTQYLIMAAIIGSLATVVIGGFQQPAPAQPSLGAAGTAVGFGVLFGIFFPAVTGFEAGVSMSGDLKDPKKSIPVGTIAAIVVGFFVYVALAIFLALRVDGQSLADDPNVLSKLSVFAPLLMAGVWGATISSALGSILGAPRILQAASADRITHRFFAKGYGPTAEPRNALLLTILIAEAGILIGELDVIARIVSMFFIAAYGFLNIACWVESWASPDFRPDFKIPKAVSLIGAVTCVLIMIQLDILAMFAACIVLGALFVYLKRRELILEGGDAYEGIWSTIVRRGLFNLSRSTVHHRNWRPNMLLFSGGEDERPGLVAIARDLAQGRGMISNFDLEETSRPRLRPRREETSSVRTEADEGVFTRVLECSNVYDSMEHIARFHGFSGVEPNTVLVGRAHSLRKAEAFAELVMSFTELDYNTLLFDEGPRDGPAPKQVDVWWSGFGNNLSFAVALVRFLLASDRWRAARPRFLIIADDAGLAERSRARLSAVLESARVQAEVRVIFNGVDRRTFSDIIVRESGESDLVLLGIPDFSREPPTQAAARMNELSANLQQVLWIRASSYFPVVAIERPVVASIDAGPHAFTYQLPGVEPLRSWVADFAPRVLALGETFYARHMQGQAELRLDGLRQFSALVERMFGTIEEALESDAGLRRSIGQFYGGLLVQAREILLPTEVMPDAEEAWNSSLTQLRAEIDGLVSSTPKSLRVTRELAELHPSADAGLLRRFRFALRRFRARLAGGKLSVAVPVRSVVSYVLTLRLPGRLSSVERAHCRAHYQYLAASHRLLGQIDSGLRALEAGRRRGTLDLATLRSEQQQIIKAIGTELETVGLLVDSSRGTLLKYLSSLVNRISGDLENPDVRSRPSARGFSRRRSDREFSELLGIGQAVDRNNQSFDAMLRVGLDLFFIRNRLRGVTERAIADVDSALRGALLSRLKRAIAKESERDDGSLQSGSVRPFNADEFFSALMGQIRPVLADVPEEHTFLSGESVERWEQGRFHDSGSATVAVRRYLESLSESELALTIRQQGEALERLTHEIRSILAQSRQSASVELEEDPAVDVRVAKANRQPDLASAAVRLEAGLETFEEQVLAGVEVIAHRLSAFFFAHAPDSIGLFVRDSKRRLLRQRLRDAARAGKVAIARFLGRLLLGRSRAKLLARRFQGEAQQWNRIARLRELREACLPSPATLAVLPSYYRHLFLDKAPPSREFWVGRRAELDTFADAVRRHKSGFGGAIFVVGAPESGKTWFCRYAAEAHFAAGQFRELFVRRPDCRAGAFADVLGLPMSAPPGVRCVIVNDLELLWERSLEGYAALREMFSYMDQHSGQTLFVLNLSVDAYVLLRESFPLETYTTATIEMEPFTAGELRDMVTRKHNVTGYQLQLGGALEKGLTFLQSARLFDALFSESFGLPGPALRSYLGSVEAVRDNVVRLKRREPISDAILRELPGSWKLAIVTVLLHKRITQERLLALCSPIHHEMSDIISTLLQARLLIPAGEFLRLEPALLPKLRQRLLAEGLL